LRNKKTLSQRKARGFWPSVLKRLQEQYDKPHCFYKSLRDLWTSASKIRQDLEKCGLSQKDLDKNQNALSKKSIIYAAVNKNTGKIYTGQTMTNVFERFQQHIWKSNQKGPSFSKALHKNGWRNFLIFPLEHIPVDVYQSKNKKETRKTFKKIATTREIFWIEKLHSYQPKGFNVQFSKRKRLRKHGKRSNPMKWKIKKMGLSPEQNGIEEPENQLSESEGEFLQPSDLKLGKILPSFSAKMFRSLDFKPFRKKCLFLEKMLLKKKLEKIDLIKYNPDNLWRMLRLLNGNFHNFSPKTVSSLNSFIFNFLKLRFKKQPSGKNSKTVVKIQWQDSSFRSSKLRSVKK
jgi:hypothetical protein